MTYRTTSRVKDSRVVISLPAGFPENREVNITIDDAMDVRTEKMNLLKQAANDPLFLADIKEVQDDFDKIDNDLE